MHIILIIILNIISFLVSILTLNVSVSKKQPNINIETIIFVSKPIDAFLYFGPTLSRLNNATIISLSSGSDNYTKSNYEFQNACKEIKIPGDNCIINEMNIEHFEKKNWSLEEVKNVVNYYKNKINSSLLITYDHKGMNNALNVKLHEAIHPSRINIKSQPLYKSSKKSVKYHNRVLQLQSNLYLADVDILFLKTPSIISRFSSFFEIVFYVINNFDKTSSYITLLQSPISQSFFQNLNALRCFQDFSFLKNLIQIHHHSSYINNLILPRVTSID